MAITQTIATLPAVLNDSTTFYEDIAERNNSLVTTVLPSINAWAKQANTTQSEINAKAEQVAAQAVDGGYSQNYINSNFFSQNYINDNFYSQDYINDNFVGVNNDQNITAVKTFTVSPIVPTPTTDTQAANKAYVDTKQANLGFTPVQQGTGIGQLGNTVKIGWSGARTKITIDATDMGNIVMDSDIRVANSSLVKTALNASGEAPIYACRTWVNFNGTGTVAIRASGNVSSISDNGTGDYTVNFITAMPDANYSVLMNIGDGTYSNRNTINDQRQTAVGQTIYSVKVISDGNVETYFDPSLFYVAIFR